MYIQKPRQRDFAILMSVNKKTKGKTSSIAIQPEKAPSDVRRVTDKKSKKTAKSTFGNENF